jgi:hypothetical protein
MSDNDDDDDAVLDVGLVDLVNDDDGRKSQRVRWVSTEPVVSNLGTSSYPFLCDTNQKDMVFVRHLLVDKPYGVPYGQVKKAWQDLAGNVNKEVDESGNHVFFPPVKTQALKDRFEKKFIPFAKAVQDGQPFRSGCDDEAAATEIQQSIESIYEDYLSGKSMTEAAKAKAASEKHRDKAMSEALRRAALGEYVPKAPDGQEAVQYLLDTGFAGSTNDAGNDAGTTTSASDRPGPALMRRRSSYSSTDDSRAPTPVEQLGSVHATFAKRSDVKIAKLERKKLKLDLEDRRLRLEESRRADEKMRQEDDKADREANRAFMLAMVSSLSNRK